MKQLFISDQNDTKMNKYIYRFHTASSAITGLVMTHVKQFKREHLPPRINVYKMNEKQICNKAHFLQMNYISC